MRDLRNRLLMQSLASRSENDRLRIEEDRAKREGVFLNECRQHGVLLRSVWDLVHTREPYDELLGTIVDHLERTQDPIFQEGLARSLVGQKAARPYSQRLIALLPRTRGGSQFALALAIQSLLSKKDAHMLKDVDIRSLEEPTCILLHKKKLL